MQKLIIAVGLNEKVTREQNPNVPITPDEIAEASRERGRAVASVTDVRTRFAPLAH